MESQFRFRWHGLDVGLKVIHTVGDERVIHNILVLEARWLDTGEWVEPRDLDLVLRFAAADWTRAVAQALTHHLATEATS